MSERRCPICERPFDPSKSDSLPFCSPRCRMADLNRWLDEEYKLPVERAEEDDDGSERREPDEE